MARPTSCAATYLVHVDRARDSVSTSTSAACAAQAVRSQRPSLRWTPRPTIVVPDALTTLEIDIWKPGLGALDEPAVDGQVVGVDVRSGLLAFLASRLSLG